MTGPQAPTSRERWEALNQARTSICTLEFALGESLGAKLAKRIADAANDELTKAWLEEATFTPP